MGLLTLLTLPFTGPAQGLLFVARSIAEEAERTWYDTDALRGALLELELHRQQGAISEEEYAAAEEALVERLGEALERRRALPSQEED